MPFSDLFMEQLSHFTCIDSSACSRQKQYYFRNSDRMTVWIKSFRQLVQMAVSKHFIQQYCNCVENWKNSINHWAFATVFVCKSTHKMPKNSYVTDASADVACKECIRAATTSWCMLIVSLLQTRVYDVICDVTTSHNQNAWWRRPGRPGPSAPLSACRISDSLDCNNDDD